MATQTQERTASDLDAFCLEVRAWLEENCPQSLRFLPRGMDTSFWGGRHPVYPSADHKAWFERMAARAWTVPTWPAQYGGGGLDAAQGRVLKQEMERIGAPDPLSSLGIMMLGPALLKFGTEEQKLEHIPLIAQGKIRWAQGYSEPGAGSDLASLTTRGEDKGDHFLVNGQKIWTTYGHKADMIFTLVRTEPDAPKHLGISFLLIDMAQAGVNASPIRMISGNEHFAQTFFDDAYVPKANLVGEQGRGWDVAKYLLTFERSSMGQSLGGGAGATIAEVALDRLGREGLAREPGLRREVAETMMETWAMQIAGERMFDAGKAGTLSPFSPNVMKLLGTELAARRTRLAMTLGGFEELAAGGRDAYDWLQAPPNCVAGGSNEVQLNVLSKRALELPEQK
jgi:acyl-CoA dehydrogenase